MGRGGTEEVNAESLLYGNALRIKRPATPWQEEASRPLASGPGQFYLDEENSQLVVRQPNEEAKAFALPEAAKEIEDVGEMDGWVVASWPDPNMFSDGVRRVGLGREAGARSSQVKEAATIPRHSKAFLTRAADGSLRFSYVDRTGGLHIEKLESGGLVEGLPAGLAYKIHDVQNDGQRNLMLTSAALGAPQGMSVYDIDRRREVAFFDLQGRPDYAAMATMGDGAPVLSTIDRDGTVSVFVNNERVFVEDTGITRFENVGNRPLNNTERSWMCRDESGAVYVVWRGEEDEDGADINAVRVSRDDRGQYVVEQKLVGNTAVGLAGAPRRPFLAEGRNGLYLGWETPGETPAPAQEVWFGNSDQAERTTAEGILAV